jgi:uncharacterized protein involved in outer membrane biogenesis
MSTAHSGRAVQSRPRRRAWPFVVGGLVLTIVLLVALWDWDWFRPLVERQASAALGRAVTIGHFDLRLGWTPTAILDDVTIANPPDFPAVPSGAPYLAHIDRLAVTADARAYVHGRRIVLPRIELDHPDVNVARLPDGRANYALSLGGGSSGPGATIGQLVIEAGHAHVVDPALKADFQVNVATRHDQGGPDQVVADADGTYAGQKITGHAVAGAVLALRDANSPYPVDAHLRNGATRLDLTGTVQDPLAFKGTNLKLHLAGASLAELSPLVGFPLPATPDFDLTGQLAYAAKRIRLDDFQGKVGSSDLAGTIAVNPGTERPEVRMDLTSRHVDLADLGGLIGSQPGRVGTPGQTPEQKRAVERAEASPRLLPTARISLPRVKAADFHVRYKGDHIVGRGVPFDSLSATLDIVDGTITLHPVSLGVGTGTIGGDITLTPASADTFHLKSDIALDRVDVGRMLAATGAVKGAGRLGGRIEMTSTGDSVASLAARGNGSVRLMLAGGNLSALLIDLSGLEFGNALLSALGLPNRATMQCFAADLPLRDGVLDTTALLVVTSEADIRVTGDLNLRDEALNYRLRTASRHFSVGSLPADIGIHGTLKDPRIMPNLGEVGARAAAAVGLGVLLTPLAALLPTVQFGTGDKEENACVALVHEEGKRATPASAATPLRR